MNAWNYDLLIFDLDGTLIDSREDIARAVNAARIACGLDPMPIEVISGFVGWGAGNLIRQCLGDDQENYFEKTFKYFRAYYLEHLLDTTKLYPGVGDILRLTQGVLKAVVTNKPSEHSIKVMEGLGIRGEFADILGGEFRGAKKPAPDALIHLMEKHSAAKVRTLMVGDSLIDMEAARNAGIATCAVTYGFGKKEDLIQAKPDYIIDVIADLEPILKRVAAAGSGT